MTQREIAATVGAGLRTVERDLEDPPNGGQPEPIHAQDPDPEPPNDVLPKPPDNRPILRQIPMIVHANIETMRT